MDPIRSLRPSSVSWARRLTLPVRGDMPISHRFCVSPLGMEKITVLPAADQQRGWERRDRCPRVVVGCSPRGPAHRTRRSLPPHPSVATSHQSRPELSYAFADVYPMQSRCFPSGDQIG